MGIGGGEWIEDKVVNIMRNDDKEREREMGEREGRKKREGG